MPTKKPQEVAPIDEHFETHQATESALNLHNAFMQCSRCCNCSFNCTHYGKGHFDEQGNYLGPGKGNPWAGKPLEKPLQGQTAQAQRSK